MRVRIVATVLAAAALASTSALANDLDKPMQVDTRALPSHVAQQVQERAAESTKALMEYMWFTRRIHHLWIEDVNKAPKDAVAANEESAKPRQMATRTTGLH